LASSTATLDEVLRFSVQEMVRLLQADLGLVFLYDEALGKLSVHPPSVVGISDDGLKSIAEIYVDPAQFRLTVTGNKRFLMSGNLSDDIRVSPLYQNYVEKFDATSAIIVPLIVRDHGAGEILVASKQKDYFNNYDLQVMATAVSQLSSVVEREQTANYTDESLLRRVEYLNAISRIVRVFNTTTDIKSLVQSVYEESVRITGSDCGSIIFFDDDIKVHPDAGVTYSAGHQSSGALMPLEQDTIHKGEPIVIDDFDHSEYNNPHTGINASLCVPIMYQGQVNGLIHLHSRSRNCFNVEVTEAVQTLAVQAAISFGNALRLHEHAIRTELLRRRAETLSKLFATTQQLSAEQPLEVALNTIAKGIQESTSFDITLFSVYEPSTGLLRRIVGRGMSVDVFEQLKAHQQPWKSVSEFFKPEFKIGEAYLIPFDQVPVVPADVHLVTVFSSLDTQLPNGWNSDDLLLVPLGLLSLDGPRDGLRPDRTTIETLEVFASQAALTISSIHQAGGLREQVEELSGELVRQKDMLVVSQGHLPVLLHKDIYQAIAVNNLEKRSRRVRAGLEITETISR
jgi:GAF domain-containing protein